MAPRRGRQASAGRALDCLVLDGKYHAARTAEAAPSAAIAGRFAPVQSKLNACARLTCFLGRLTIRLVTLSLDMTRDDARPYFLWDTRMTAGELRQRLREAEETERILWMARILREARYQDVWAFLSLEDVLSHWEQLRGQLGRMTGFWEFLLREWRENGLIPASR
jgi:hypothetical protein